MLAWHDQGDDKNKRKTIKMKGNGEWHVAWILPIVWHGNAKTPTNYLFQGSYFQFSMVAPEEYH